MKGLGILFSFVAGSVFTASVALANPGLLPQHPGYPAGGKSPVTGQRTANDPGQTNAVGNSFLTKAAGSLDSAAINNVTDPNRARIKQSAGAGRLPQVEGPLNKVNPNPTGVTATKIQ